MSKPLIAGVDPGVKTGVAIWNYEQQRFLSIETFNIIEAMRRLLYFSEHLGGIIFEDARLRGGKPGKERLQGAGSIKRDSKIWEEFCKCYLIPFQPVKPTSGNTKWKADYFKRITGWDKRTSEHSRDAAVLVFGMKNFIKDKNG